MLSTITVTSLADNLNVDGQVTLREALQAANSDASVDGSTAGQSGVQNVIVFQPGLTGTIALDAGLGQMTISSSVKIQGLGAAGTIIDAQQNSRVFNITSGAGNVALDSLTIENGKTTAAGASGGAIASVATGTLAISNVTLSGNSTTGNNAYGGAILCDQGPMTLTNSTLSGNSTHGQGSSGGAVQMGFGDLTIANSTISGNFTIGGLAQGGALHTKFGKLTVTNSTISGNSTQGAGASGGAINAAFGAVTLTNSTLTGNSTTGGSGGGAIESGFANITATNTTIVQNQASLSIGGGIAVTSATITLRNAILAQNTDNGTAPDMQFGGGTLTVSHSLIGDNTDTGLAAAPIGAPDVNGNFIGTHAAPILPLLGALASNGGTTQTMALLAGSPAINAGSNALATDPGPDHIPGTADDIPLTTDQRGGTFARIVAVTVDMGAFEIQSHPPAAPTVNSLVVNTQTPVLTGTWDRQNATVLQVTVNGTTFKLGTDSRLASDGSGHWTLTTSASIPDGTYNVTVHTVNEIGEATDTTATNALVIDTIAPATPTVNALLTNNNKPILTGTWDQGTPGGATVLQVAVNSTTFTLGSSSQLTSDGSGHWTLTTTTTIPDGTYDVLVHTADAAGNIANDTTTNELTVDTVAPATPTVNRLVTNHSKPTLTGTWDQGTPGGATVLQVTVNSTTFTLGSSPQLTSDGAGHWTLATTAVIPDGTYDVLVHTADAAGNIANDTTTNELTVDTVAPATPTVNSLATSNPTPTLTGSWDSAGASLLQVTVNSTTFTLGTSSHLSSSGTNWTLKLAGTPALANGTYNVMVHTADAAGNIANDTTTNELLVDTTAPTAASIAAQLANIGETVNISAAITTDAPDGLTASINWGDGTTTGGTIAKVGGILTVTGSKSYATAGLFNVQVTVHNAVGLGPTVPTTVSVSQHGDLHVTGTTPLTLTSNNTALTYDFAVQFGASGVTLTGAHGTTFNGLATLFVSGAKGVTATLGNGNNQVRVGGSGGAFTLKMGTGRNDLTFQSFTGGAVSVSATGGLATHALSSTLASLKVTAGSTAGNLVQAQGLHVTGSTSLTLGSGTGDSVQINDSHFNAFTLSAAGSAASVQIENGAADGTGTQFDGAVSITLGGSAQLTFSPLAGSDQTKFSSSVTITAVAPNALFHRQNVVFVKPPKLTHVTIV